MSPLNSRDSSAPQSPEPQSKIQNPTSKIPPYPLLLEPILLEKVWGGRNLEKFGKRLPPGANIGESWEVADLSETSTSGAGGGAMRSIIANGPLQGRTLHDALELWGDNLIPHDRLTHDNAFPLLVKLLDARENLSVQVHPSPAYIAAWNACFRPASSHGNAGFQPASGPMPQASSLKPALKTECWFILRAAPDAVIYKGLKPGVTPETLRAHAKAGGDAIVSDLLAHPAIPGDMHNLPSGTIHALGAEVTVAEIQTPSDTTFRLYDWNRRGRELHIEEALACIDFENPPPPPTRTPNLARSSSNPGGTGMDSRPAEGDPHLTRLVTTDHFKVDALQLAPNQSHSITPPAPATAPGPANPTPTCTILILLQGQATLRATGAAKFPDLHLTPGQTALIPAASANTAHLHASEAATALLATPGQEFFFETRPQL